jgi:hypothetical protein
MKKFKIAVCLSGITRYWKTTSKLFEYWNSIYDNVDYYFFISTWGEPTRAEKPIYAKSPIKLPPSGFEKNDFSNYPFLTKYEYINQDEFKMFKNQGNPNTQYYAYSLYKCNELRKSSGINFDGVIHTRTDIWIPKVVLSKIISLFGCPYPKKNKVQPEMFFTTSGTTIALAKPKNRFFINNDNFSFAHPLAMDKYANMYFDAYIHGTNPSRTLHRIQAEQLMLHRIYNFNMGGITFLLRDKSLGLEKRAVPTIDELEGIIDTKGLDYLFNTNVTDLQKSYFMHKDGPNLGRPGRKKLNQTNG